MFQNISKGKSIIIPILWREGCCFLCCLQPTLQTGLYSWWQVLWSDLGHFGPPRKEVRKSEAELGRMQASCHPLRLAFFILDINFLDVSALVHFEGWRSFLLWLFLQPWSTFLCRFCLFVPLLGQDADTSCLPALGRWTRCGLRTSLQTGTSSQKYSCIHLKHTHTHIQKEVTFKKKSKLGTDFFFLIW